MAAISLKKQYEKCLDASNRLDSELQELGRIASDVYGRELKADICNGDEIEFRPIDDEFICLEIEDIIKQ